MLTYYLRYQVAKLPLIDLSMITVISQLVDQEHTSSAVVSAC